MNRIRFAVLLALAALASNTWAAFLGSGCGAELVEVSRFQLPVHRLADGRMSTEHTFITGYFEEARWVEGGGAGPWEPKEVIDPETGQKMTFYFCGFKPGTLGTVPVSRFYGDVQGVTGLIGPNSHFYTASRDEAAGLKAGKGWIFEGEAFNVMLPLSDGTCHPGTKPVLRAYNNGYRDQPATNDGNHRYTTNLQEYADVVAQGWSGEGTVFCVPDQAAGFAVANTAPLDQCGRMDSTQHLNASLISAASGFKKDVCTDGGFASAVAISGTSMYVSSFARNIATAKVELPLGATPTSITALMGPAAAIEPDEFGRLWLPKVATATKGASVTVWSTGEQRIVADLPVPPGYTSYVVVFYRGRGYFSATKDATPIAGEVGEVFVVDLKSLTMQGSIKTASTPVGLTAANGFLYVGVRGDTGNGSIQIVDLTRGALGEVVKNVPFPGPGTPVDLAVDSLNGWVWVSEFESHKLHPYNILGGSWGNAVDGGWTPASLKVVSRGGINHVCWVTAGAAAGRSGPFNLSCVDGTIHTLVATLPLRPYPDGLKLVPFLGD